jgi:hypothetical protein
MNSDIYTTELQSFHNKDIKYPCHEPPLPDLIRYLTLLIGRNKRVGLNRRLSHRRVTEQMLQVPLPQHPEHE